MICPAIPGAVSSTTRYELWRWFDDFGDGTPGKWMLWHRRKDLNRLKILKTQMMEQKNVPEGNIRLVVVSEERRIIPS
jgi:hypothetical protein